MNSSFRSELHASLGEWGYALPGDEPKEIADAAPYDDDADMVPIVRRQLFSFDGRPSGSSQLVVLAEGVDSSRWEDAQLLVIGHAKNGWKTGAGLSTNAVLTVEVANQWLSQDEPRVSFSEVEPTASSAGIQDSTLTPFCQVIAVPKLGSMLRVRLFFTQGSVAAADAQTVTLSVFLIGRWR